MMNDIGFLPLPSPIDQFYYQKFEEELINENSQVPGWDID